MNPLREEHRERLSRALGHSYQELRPFRASRRELIQDYAGSRYGEDPLYMSRPEIYVNLIQQTAQAYQVALAYNEPRFLVTNKRGEHESWAQRFQTALNSYSQKIYLGDSLRAVILDAIFMVGIGKIYLADSAEVYHENDIWMDPGMPYFGRVSLDNWCHDVSKSDFRRCAFLSDRYQMNLETARNCEYFEKHKKDLQASRWSDRSDRWELTSSISSDADHTDAEIEDVIDLVDVYLPEERVVCTWPVREKFELLEVPPLVVMPWDGPETGPYRFLSLIDVPDNVMPTSPAQSLCALFYLFNFLMRKNARRARQQKTVLPYEPAAGEDMTRAMEAQDMQTVKVRSLKQIDTLNFPGPDQSTVNFAYGLMELFNRASGNVEAQLGLGPSADTLGQEQMIDQKLGGVIADSRRKLNCFVSQVGQDVGELLYDDPLQVIPGKREVAGFEINADWRPASTMPRPVSFAEMEVVIEPYVMEYKSPQQRLSGIFAIVDRLGPLIPMAQQQGEEFQFRELLDDVAELSGEPRIKKYFKSAPPPMTAPGEAPSMRAPGVGQYTRTNVSAGPTSQGRLAMLSQQQPQQMAQSGMGAA